MTKSEIFRVYNQARKAAKEGKLDLKRVNRALGILQSKEARPYHTTVKSCDCMDHQRTGKPCKHMIAAMIAYRIENPRN